MYGPKERLNSAVNIIPVVCFEYTKIACLRSIIFRRDDMHTCKICHHKMSCANNSRTITASSSFQATQELVRADVLPVILDVEGDVRVLGLLGGPVGVTSATLSMSPSTRMLP